MVFWETVAVTATAIPAVTGSFGSCFLATAVAETATVCSETAAVAVAAINGLAFHNDHPARAGQVHH